LVGSGGITHKSMENDEYAIMYQIEQTHWWFVGKQFLIKSILRRLYAKGTKERNILDIGCGTGIILKLLSGFGTAYGMELSPEAIQFLGRRDLKLVVRSDANAPIAFRNNSFSAITCLDVLEHVDNDFFLIKELVRVCKPGGHIIITVPAFNVLWSVHDDALHHRRRYTRNRLLEKVDQLNCKVIKSSYYNTALILPILVVRKLKRLFSKKQVVRSDFFMRIPRWLNALLTFLFTSEICCLQFLSFPFGVSFLLILQKWKGNTDASR